MGRRGEAAAAGRVSGAAGNRRIFRWRGRPRTATDARQDFAHRARRQRRVRGRTVAVRGDPLSLALRRAPSLSRRAAGERDERRRRDPRRATPSAADPRRTISSGIGAHDRGLSHLRECFSTGRATGAGAGVSEFRDLLAALVARRDLTATDAAGAIGAMMDGAWTPAQTGAFLTALAVK